MNKMMKRREEELTYYEIEIKLCKQRKRALKKLNYKLLFCLLFADFSMTNEVISRIMDTANIFSLSSIIKNFTIGAFSPIFFSIVVSVALTMLMGLLLPAYIGRRMKEAFQLHNEPYGYILPSIGLGIFVSMLVVITYLRATVEVEDMAGVNEMGNRQYAMACIFSLMMLASFLVTFSEALSKKDIFLERVYETELELLEQMSMYNKLQAALTEVYTNLACEINGKRYPLYYAEAGAYLVKQCIKDLGALYKDFPASMIELYGTKNEQKSYRKELRERTKTAKAIFKTQKRWEKLDRKYGEKNEGQ